MQTTADDDVVALESAILAATQQSSDFVMVSEKLDVQIGGAIPEHEAQCQIRPALKGSSSQLSDADTTVDMRSAEALVQLPQCFQTLRPLCLR